MLWLGLIIMSAVLWLVSRRRRLRVPEPDLTLERLSGSAATAQTATAQTVIAQVVCVTVTPERQEWRSLKTGRRFDVLTSRGLPEAQVGDEAEVLLENGSYRVRVPDSAEV